MTKTFLLAAAASLTAAGLASAQSEQGGRLGASVGIIDVDGADNTDTYAAYGDFITPLDNNWAFQVDASWLNANPDGAGSFDVFAGQAHFVNREEGRHAWGGFLSVADSDSTDTIWGGGAEGQLYSENWVFSGEAGWFDADGGDLYGASAGATYVVNGGFTLGGDFGIGQYDVGGGDIDFNSFGAEAEWMFVPGWSVSGRVDRTDTDFGDATGFRLGLNFDFGGDLESRATSGASFAGGRRLLGVAFD